MKDSTKTELQRLAELLPKEWSVTEGANGWFTFWRDEETYIVRETVESPGFYNALLDLMEGMKYEVTLVGPFPGLTQQWPEPYYVGLRPSIERVNGYCGKTRTQAIVRATIAVLERERQGR